MAKRARPDPERDDISTQPAVAPQIDASVPHRRSRKIALWAASTAGVALIGGVITLIVESIGPTVQDRLAPAPVSVLVREEWSGSFILPPDRSLADDDVPRGYGRMLRWARRQEDLTDARTTLSLVIEGRLNGTVTIVDMRPRVLQRAKPLPGTYLAFAGGEGVEDIVGLVFDLDETAPVAYRAGELATPLGPYFDEQFITLQKGEELTFKIYAGTKRCSCTWVIDMDLVVDGEQQTVTIGDGSIGNRTSPFVTSSCRNASSGFRVDPATFIGPSLIPIDCSGRPRNESDAGGGG